MISDGGDTRHRFLHEYVSVCKCVCANGGSMAILYVGEGFIYLRGSVCENWNCVIAYRFCAAVCVPALRGKNLSGRSVGSMFRIIAGFVEIRRMNVRRFFMCLILIDWYKINCVYENISLVDNRELTIFCWKQELARLLSS